MTFEEAVNRLHNTASVKFDAKEGNVDPGAVEKAFGFNLPAAHMGFLAKRGGCTVGDGFFRLYGLNDLEDTSLTVWNKPETWKFAWDHLVDEFFCFGGTLWGDQYAYRIADLKAAKTAPVYLLENSQMNSQEISPDFEHFITDVFIGKMAKSFDGLVIGALEKFGGPLETREMIVFIPPAILGGELELDTMQRINMVAGMIAYGDIYTQLRTVPDGAIIEGLHHYIDERNNDRLKVMWSEDEEV